MFVFDHSEDMCWGFLVLILKHAEKEHSQSHSFNLLQHRFQNASEDVLILNVICINCCKGWFTWMWSYAFDHTVEKCALLSTIYFYYYHYYHLSYVPQYLIFWGFKKYCVFFLFSGQTPVGLAQNFVFPFWKPIMKQYRIYHLHPNIGKNG
jgi:hypothetical protein